MRRETLLMFAATAALLVPGAAWAQSGSWSGLYVGFHAGYGWGNNDYKFAPGGSGFDGNDLFSDNVNGSTFSQSPNGGDFGGHFGVNSEMPGNWVWGVEASFDGSTLSQTSLNPLAPTVPPDVTYETDINWFGSVTPRLGYDDDGLLIYAKGGLAFGEMESKLLSTQVVGMSVCTATVHCGFSQTADGIGWTIGAGLDYRWDEDWAIGLEYNYYDLSTQHFGGETTPNTTWPVDYTMHPTFSTVVARITFMLGQP